jgi:hypothetical protein
MGAFYDAKVVQHKLSNSYAFIRACRQVMNRLVLAGLGLKALPWEVTLLAALLKRCKIPCFPAILHFSSGVFTPSRAIGIGREQQLPQRHFLQILQRSPRFIRGQASVVSLVGCGSKR